jgi:prepilin-type N-terminal cleavage/methylation domain-containing protein
MKKKGFTLIELLVVIAIIAMLLAILMPALNKVKKIAQRVVCGTNLKGLGTAQAVYANDYEDQYTRQGGTAPLTTTTWAQTTGGWRNPAKVWTGDITLSVGASLYLLVREADVSPKSFVCGSSTQTAYDGQNPDSFDLVELWDFGDGGANSGLGPQGHVSYSFHIPYSRNPASGSSSASFAVMSDRNPWFDPKLTESSSSTADNYMGAVEKLGEYFFGTQTEKWMKQKANAQPHDREGQNVMYGDGHNAYEKVPDVGVRHDNIFTVQVPNPGSDPQTAELAVRCGRTKLGLYDCPNTIVSPTLENLWRPAGPQDSILVNDTMNN